MINRLLPIAVTLLARTLRFQWSGEAVPKNAVIMFWHGKMLSGWYSVRRNRPIALVSQSKDGNLLASVLAFWGYKLSRGSSKKSGMDALNKAMEVIRTKDADTLVITPDGPRGPRHRFKRGAFIAARELSLPLYMLEIECHSTRVLKSWDKFEVPLPFSRISIRVVKLSTEDFPTQDREAQESWLTNVSRQFDR
ncbi:MAG TPA: DUF374 domain-containing protein [Candidatus Kapabacteria bacterium]|nr:DUF374 domain-containing protein [Candidatus Kapabacteria bacterium]